MTSPVFLALFISGFYFDIFVIDTIGEAVCAVVCGFQEDAWTDCGGLLDLEYPISDFAQVFRKDFGSPPLYAGYDYYIGFFVLRDGDWFVQIHLRQLLFLLRQSLVSSY